MAKPATPTPRDIDPSILTPDEIAAIQLEAEEEVLLKAKDAAKAQLKKKLVLEAERNTGIKEPLVDIYIDLAPYCDRILIDNKAFMQGQTYTVPQSQAIGMGEIMQRTWQHQSIVDGKSENFYRKQRTSHVTERGAAINAPNLMRA